MPLPTTGKPQGDLGCVCGGGVGGATLGQLVSCKAASDAGKREGQRRRLLQGRIDHFVQPNGVPLDRGLCPRLQGSRH